MSISLVWSDVNSFTAKSLLFFIYINYSIWCTVKSSFAYSQLYCISIYLVINISFNSVHISFTNSIMVADLVETISDNQLWREFPYRAKFRYFRKLFLEAQCNLPTWAAKRRDSPFERLPLHIAMDTVTIETIQFYRNRHNLKTNLKLIYFFTTEKVDSKLNLEKRI